MGEDEALVFIFFCAMSAPGHLSACEPQRFGEAWNILELCLHILLHRLKPAPQMGSWALDARIRKSRRVDEITANCSEWDAGCILRN